MRKTILLAARIAAGLAFAASIGAEVPKWAAVVKRAGIAVD